MENEQTYCCVVDTPLGKAMAAAKSKALVGFWFVGQKYFPQQTRDWVEEAAYPVFGPLRSWLERYFAAQAPAMDLPLAPQGTPFQKAVWDFLLEITHGQLTTYGQIAQQMAVRMGQKTMSAQAVGGAVGHNPISVLIPCHRVIGADGRLTGYAGGLDKKRKLLQLERALLAI